MVLLSACLIPSPQWTAGMDRMESLSFTTATPSPPRFCLRTLLRPSTSTPSWKTSKWIKKNQHIVPKPHSTPASRFIDSNSSTEKAQGKKKKFTEGAFMTYSKLGWGALSFCIMVLLKEDRIILNPWDQREWGLGFYFILDGVLMFMSLMGIIMWMLLVHHSSPPNILDVESLHISSKCTVENV